VDCNWEQVEGTHEEVGKMLRERIKNLGNMLREGNTLRTWETLLRGGNTLRSLGNMLREGNTLRSLGNMLREGTR